MRGWVRTRRDSKAGLSFIHVHDGSCFEPIQVVAPGDLPNYQTEVGKLGAGCAVAVTGTLVASQGKGQAVELAARAVEVRRLGRRPRDLPHPAEAAHAGVPARGGAPAAAHQHAGRADPGAALPEPGDPSLLPRRRLLLDPHADHHRQRLRRGGGDVPRQHARPRQPAAHARGQGRLRAGLLRAARPS